MNYLIYTIKLLSSRLLFPLYNEKLRNGRLNHLPQVAQQGVSQLTVCRAPVIRCLTKPPRIWLRREAPGRQRSPHLGTGTDLLGLLVENGGHVQQGAALVQRRGERLPLLLQLVGDLLDLLRGVVAGLHQAIGHRHDPVYVDIHVLRKGQRERAPQGKANRRLPLKHTDSIS